MDMTKKNEIVHVMGRRWDTSRSCLFDAPAGLSLEDIVLQSLAKAYEDKVYTEAQYRVLLKYARARWNGIEVAREHWKDVFPQKADRIEVLHGVRGGGGGGGGGKNPVATVLKVIVTVAAAVLSYFFPPAAPLVGLAAMGLMVAVDAIFPASTPSLPSAQGTTAEKESQTYSLNGGRNQTHINGYVPLVLGKHRLTPPLGAKSWTEWKGDDQYFNMLLVWGHPDMDVSDFRIGDTALSKFADVKHKLHQNCTGKGLTWFAKQYSEESVGATLEHGVGKDKKPLKSGTWYQRTVGEANELSVDIAFPGGLTTIDKNTGDTNERSIEIEIQYKPTIGGSWRGFAVTKEGKIKAGTLTYSLSDINDAVSVFYKSGKLYAVKRGESVSGGTKIYPLTGSAFDYFYGGGVSVEPSGDKLKVTVQPAVFKKGGKVYSIGGGKTRTYSYWDDVYGLEYSTSVTGKTTTLTIESPFVIGVNSSGNPVKSAGVVKLFPTKDSGVKGGNVTWKKTSTTEYGRSYGFDDEWSGGYTTVYKWQASITSGSYTIASSGKATIRGSKQKQIVKSYTQSGLSLKSWDVRIRRNTADSTDSYIIDECQWVTMRAIIDKPAFDTPIPICVSELHIRASEQLSGYVSDFSGLCYCKIPDWTPQTTTKKNGKTVTVPGHWKTKRNTSNPASIMRYLLTSKHSLIKPFSASRLDNSSIVALWKWCKKNDFRFDYVCDSEENLWARLVSVLAPAMAAPTTDVDGLWGAIYDSPDKTPKQLFTPRNSWGMSIQRGFAHLPDALRVSFVDETDDWVQKEGFVYNDGYGKEKVLNKNGTVKTKQANDVVEWDFPGVTNWKRMHKLARYHLAQMLHRQMTVNISTDWEWLAVHRGDLVGLASDVLMNTFGTARVMRLLYRVSGAKINEDNNGIISEDLNTLIDNGVVEELYGPGEKAPSDAILIGLEIDDTIIFSSPKPARYGIAVRNSTGKLNIHEIVPEYDCERSILRFKNRSTATKTPPKCGDLVSVSILGEEYEEYLVASITPSENMSAQLTLVPYKTKEIMKAANGKIPEYEAPVILDVVRGGTLPTPHLGTLVSDERVATISASGGVQINIGGTWSVPASADAPSFYTVEMRATSKDDAGTTKTGTASCTDVYAIVPNVKKDSVWYCKIRIHDPVSGLVSAWSNQVEHKVTGLVAPPPRPTNVNVVPDYPNGIKILWDEVNVIDLRRYKITGAVTATTKGKETEYVYAPKEKTGKQTYNVWSEDTTGNVSKTSGTASFTIYAPGKPVFVPFDPNDENSTGARLENDGIALQYTDDKKTWPIVQYEGVCKDKKATATKTDPDNMYRIVVPKPKDFINGDVAKVRAKDYFLNWSAWSDEVQVQVVPPLTPDIRIEVNDNGTAVFTWDDCRTYTDIKHYLLEGASKGSTTALYVVLNVADIVWVSVPGASYQRGRITERVTAVDKWGFTSAPGEKTFDIDPPYNPLIRVVKRTDGLHLEWQDCKRTFKIEHYIVRDFGRELSDFSDTANQGGETYTIDGTSQALAPRIAGKYTFSVQAFDCVGLFSSEMFVTETIIGVGAISATHTEVVNGQTVTVEGSLKAQVDGSDVLLTWREPETSWPIETYKIAWGNGTPIGSAKTTYYRFPAPIAGSYLFEVTGVDIAGNWGPAGAEVGITINEALAPDVTAELDGDGVTIKWEARAGVNTLPIIAWDLVRQYDEVVDGHAVTREQDYGRLDVTSLTISSIPKGNHTFLVRGIDSAGYVSHQFGTVDFVVAPPGKVTFYGCSTVDNNILLYWTQPNEIFFPIAFYLFESDLGVTNGGYVEMARIDALFASAFETKSGRYSYRITPVDTAGNLGTPTAITMTVSQPPDFVMYHDVDSAFGGIKGNLVLDGAENMIGPARNETWQENIERASIFANQTIDSWELKKNNGMEYFTSPTGGAKLARWDGAVWARICYQDCGANKDTFFPSKDEAWNYANEAGTLESQLYALRDFGDKFLQVNGVANAEGKFEFLMFEDDASGPLSGNASKYIRWKQTDNPATTYYGDVQGATAADAVEGYEEIAKVGASANFGGLALSSQASTLMDGNPKHGNYWCAVATTAVYQNGIPALGGSSRYGQLWVRLPAGDITDYGWAQYVEVVDVNTMVPSTKITVTPTMKTLAGNPTLRCGVEVSGNGTEWRPITDDALQCYATSFQYVRYTITILGGLVAISNLNYKLDVKRKTDFGKHWSVHETMTIDGVEYKPNCEGYTNDADTPMKKGTWVPFNVDFVDVDALPKPNVINHPEYTAYTVFEDVLNPKGFSCFVLDRNGNRVTAEVDWSAFGV